MGGDVLVVLQPTEEHILSTSEVAHHLPLRTIHLVATDEKLVVVCACVLRLCFSVRAHVNLHEDASPSEIWLKE